MTKRKGKGSYVTNLENDNTELISSTRKRKGKTKGKLKEKMKVKGSDGVKSKEFDELMDKHSNPTMEASSSVVKITRDMIFSMNLGQNLMDVSPPSKVTRGLLSTSKVQKIDGIKGSSVVKVTREMIRR
jgi:hypothetical protein